MKKSQIRVGHVYSVRTEDGLKVIWLDKIEILPGRTSKVRTRFCGTDMMTGRKVYVRESSAFVELIVVPKGRVRCFLCDGTGRSTSSRGRSKHPDGKVRCPRCRGTGGVGRDQEWQERGRLGIGVMANSYPGGSGRPVDDDPKDEEE